MINSNSLMTVTLTQFVTVMSLLSLADKSHAVSTVQVTCDRQTKVPTVIATLSNQEAMQVTPILSFLPEYFSATEALETCESTAAKLNLFYNEDRMNYLASDTIDEKPVICAVERRGLGCDSYNSDVLFALSKPVSPAELLFNMLGSNFKGSQLPSSRTVSRIYTDLRPPWWPF
ncbi:MAG: COP23 domain-containing protein [Cyanobacteria bacterium P01_G01_bin.67]